MFPDRVRREADNHRDNQEQNKGKAKDFIRQDANLKFADKQRYSTQKEQQHREIHESLQRHQDNADSADQPRKVWGLNHLQDMKGALDNITGAYNPKQEVWKDSDSPPKPSRKTSPQTNYPGGVIKTDADEIIES